MGEDLKIANLLRSLQQFFLNGKRSKRVFLKIVKTGTCENIFFLIIHEYIQSEKC